MIEFSKTSLSQLYAQAVQHHMAGRGAEAERGYRQVLAQAPQHADTWHMLGVLACQHGKLDAAMDYMGRAVALNPRQAAYRSNLGEVFRQAQKWAEAEEHLKTAIALDGRLADARTNLAALYAQQERYPESLAAAEGVLAFAPGNAGALRFKGDALIKLKRRAEALAAYAAALTVDPGFVDVRFNAACVRAEMGNYAEAEADFRQVLAQSPQDWDARLQLAEVLERLGRATEAYRELRTLVEMNPRYARGFSRLANLLRNNDRVDEALEAYAQAAALDPQDWITQANMSFALRDQARLEEALAMQRQLLARHPGEAALHSGLIFTMQLVPDLPREEIARQQAAWNRQFVDTAAAERPALGHARDPERRLRIGYLSADLRGHPVGWFMRPLLRNHDRAAVEVFCYRAARNSDGVTTEIAAAADQMISLAEMSDTEAAQRIRADGIDILVDLSNHTIDNRLPVLARRPAPVQISYLAFNAGTGLETIDWRMTDGLVDPPPSPDDASAFERPLRLAETYWCYAAHAAAGAVTPLPALAAGHVTFGSFNYFSKCNDQVLLLWARLLLAVAGSRLLISVPTGSRQEHVRRLFVAQGIAPERLLMTGRVKDALYFENYGKVDIALDPFPWAGGTTTCDALYMGVPVVTLAGPVGQTLQRGGLSLLTHLGRAEWIAWSPEEYLAKAAALAADGPRLARIRAELRGQMERSVLMDAPRFARQVEAAYRQVWRAWCQSPA